MHNVVYSSEFCSAFLHTSVRVVPPCTGGGFLPGVGRNFVFGGEIGVLRTLVVDCSGRIDVFCVVFASNVVTMVVLL